MQISAPIYVLKRKAKLFARETDTPLHRALDKVAIHEGYRSWSHLASSSADTAPARQILDRLRPGDLALVGARPGQGKTLLGLELAAKASGKGRKGFFFTLEYHEREVTDRFETMGIDPCSNDNSVVIDTSDDVSADYIIRRLRSEERPKFIVVDYLQLLDQKRTNPSLDDQMASLRNYLDQTDAICAVISQIDRSFDLQGKSMPGKPDIRLPNPLDLTVFNTFFFMHNGKLLIDQAS